MRREAWLQEKEKVQQSATADKNSDKDIVATPEVDELTASNLDSSVACPTGMIVDDVEVNNLGSSETTPPDMIIGFESDQCGYTSISDKGLKQHIRMKRRILQVDGAPRG